MSSLLSLGAFCKETFILRPYVHNSIYPVGFAVQTLVCTRSLSIEMTFWRFFFFFFSLSCAHQEGAEELRVYNDNDMVGC